ncbi:hypothetical protein JCGZ_21934 [Jatropha curcas]|uniref:Uncharacterized protein n=1 Tax=Jatropha curcas TaxID=180498 RepID=A0A067JF98_JATCU|nr:uncharacterized protein LOC105649998 [Jatropha curcas]KDP21463.1 hypothetical protein JCGZ_21934 [Jatropha curcas]
MARKPSASKVAEKSQKHGSTNPHVEPENNSPSLEKVDKQPENTTPILESQEANSSRTSSRKKVKNTPTKVRRSERLSNAVMARESHDIQCIIQEVTVSESDKEDEPAEEELPEPTLDEKTSDERTSDEKVDYIIQLLEAQQKTMDELNSKGTGRTFFSESFSTGDVTYKTLYIDSQKKVEALTEENDQLFKKLEYALGKIEVYEKGNHMVTEVLEKLKDVLRDAFWFSMTKAPEATVERCLECKTSAKRKRLDKEIEKN